MDTLAMAAELKRLREENKRLRLLVPLENQTADRDLFTKKTSHKHKSVRELLEKGEARDNISCPGPDSRVSNESWTSCTLLKKATHRSNRRKRKRLPPNLDDTAEDKAPEERGDDGEVGSESNGGDCRIRLVQKNKFAHCVGRYVGVWWKDDRTYYYGTILRHNDYTGKCEVLYDVDGVREWLDFSKEKLDWSKSRKECTFSKVSEKQHRSTSESEDETILCEDVVMKNCESRRSTWAGDTQASKSSISKEKLGRPHFFTPEEDEKLLQWVQEHGAKDWRRIAENVPGRDGRQCWQRWHCTLNPDINHGPWSEDEDKILVDNHKTLGSKWSKYRTLLPGRTDQAIRKRWGSLMRKSASKGEYATCNHWTPEEDKQLLQWVQEHGAKDWRLIAEKLPGRDEFQCRKRWHDHLNPDIIHGPWSEDEDKILMDNHKTLGSKWSKYRTLLPGRTGKVIRVRWNTLMRMSASKEKLATSYYWTPEEDKQLRQWVQEHGAKDWRLIAEKLPGRDRRQCRNRWHSQLNPDIIHGPWSEDEDKILVDNHKTLGSKWSKYRTLLPGRTYQAIRKRWGSLMRKNASKGELATSYHWTPEEDKQLLQWVQEHGAKDWRLIAEKLPGRDEFRCWHRWHYQLNPDIIHGPWSENEDKILMDNHKTLGSKWSKYRTLLPGRTGKAIRNRWNILMRRSKCSTIFESDGL